MQVDIRYNRVQNIFLFQLSASIYVILMSKMAHRSMRALENHQIVELFEKHHVVSAILSSTCLHLNDF